MQLLVKIHSTSSETGRYSGERMIDMDDIELAIARFLRAEEHDEGIVVDEIKIRGVIVLLPNKPDSATKERSE